MNLILITACPSGMATTFLAAKRLEQAAMRLGWNVHVEMHGEIAPLQAASAEQIANADLIVVAADHVPAPERFEGKRLFQAPIASALPDPSAFLSQAKREAPIYSAPAATAAAPTNSAGGKKIVAVTACPTGVAHTFMAAEALTEAGKAMGHQIRVETQGSVGAQNKLTEAEIADADVVVLACDIEVDPSRFAGKRVYRTSTGNALKKPRPTLEAAFTDAVVEDGTLAAALMQIGGGTAFALMIPVLAGYIAYSIADRPGIAPGMIGGMLAAEIGSGFIGGILAGFLAGYVALAVTRYVKLPSSVESLKPILIIPLIASLVTGLTMIYVIGEPVAAVLSALTSFLESMGSTNAVLLGILLGAMMCFDLGGPVNKAAYTFGVGLLASETYGPMAAIMAAGMVPAIGMGIASFVARNKFSAPEREAGKASFVLGLCFISEGAIPFAAKDPLRVIPACIAGGAVTGALSMLVGAKLMALHGGIFVLLIPNAITPALLYLGAIVVGSLITGLGYAFIKRGAAQVAVAS